jgi:hypothetical protein
MANTKPVNPISDLLTFPLMSAIFGRRARRFAMGMEIPSGPLAFRSRHAPVPLSELEQAILIAAATGVTGWNFGIPHTPSCPKEVAHYPVRPGGRTAPTAAGIGTPALFYTDDQGIYLANLRDTQPTRSREFEGETNDVERILTACRQHTVKLGDQRLDLPQNPPYVMEHNLWVANAPGTTLFIPVADESEECLAILAIFAGSGYMLIDDYAKRPAGNLAPFVRSGLLTEAKAVPLSFVEQFVHSMCSTEIAFMAHNAVLTLQGMGLGGWFFTGIDPSSVLGAYADQGIKGLGFRFITDSRWTLPNPLGLDSHYEGLCPPYQKDMRAAVQVLARRKFGPGGAYDRSTAGPYRRNSEVKGSVTPYGAELLECLGEMAQYIYDTYGKFPATIPTILVAGYVQAQHIDTEFYDTHFQPGAYLPTHAGHMARWHDERGPA